MVSIFIIIIGLIVSPFFTVGCLLALFDHPILATLSFLISAYRGARDMVTTYRKGIAKFTNRQ